MSSLTLPNWGGLQDGELYEHPTPALATSVLDYSSLPTPRTSDTNGSGKHGDGGLDLRTAVTMLPTPTAMDHVGCRQDFTLESPNRRLRETAKWLGESMAPPLHDGKQSQDDQPQHQLSLGGLALPA